MTQTDADLLRLPAHVRAHITHAEAMAHHAANGVEARWWCTTCEAHRVRTPGADCPCCEQEAS